MSNRRSIHSLHSFGQIDESFVDLARPDLFANVVVVLEAAKDLGPLVYLRHEPSQGIFPVELEMSRAPLVPPDVPNSLHSFGRIDET